VLIDELHAQKTRQLWDTLRYAGPSRRQPLQLAITTAGFAVQDFYGIVVLLPTNGVAIDHFRLILMLRLGVISEHKHVFSRLITHLDMSPVCRSNFVMRFSKLSAKAAPAIRRPIPRPDGLATMPTRTQGAV
jgi:hypothetical protein